MEFTIFASLRPSSCRECCGFPNGEGFLETVLCLHYGQPSRKTYIGVTANLERRVWEHRTKQTDGHTKQYNKVLLVYIEEFVHIEDAIAREKQLKKWSSVKKEALIERNNPRWLDLSADWYR